MSTSDTDVPSSTPDSGALSAGAQLRSARQAKGVHLAVLSAHLKVPVRQLEALEADAHASLGGPAFVRALALAVCRQLQLSPTSVLAALPPTLSPLAKPIESIEPLPPAMGHKPGWGGLSAVPKPVWGALVLMLGAVAVFVWWPASAPTPDTVATAPSPVVAALPDTAPPVAAALVATPAPTVAPAIAPAVVPVAPPTPVLPPKMPPAPAAAEPIKPAAASAATGMRLRVSDTMWVEVRDAQGQQPLKRLVRVGETVELPPPGPYFVYLSKADRADLSWQGKAVDLSAHTQNNEVRMRLQP